MTLDELWNCFTTYPRQLNYFIEAKNVVDKIEDPKEMDEFIKEYGDFEVTEWEAEFDTSILWVDIQRRKKNEVQ